MHKTAPLEALLEVSGGVFVYQHQHRRQLLDRIKSDILVQLF